MQKQKVYNIADSNIANLGSDLEKKVRFEAAQHEEAWKNAGKAAGLEIWRVQQFKIVPVPKNTYGTFYSGDSYIVLHTYASKRGSKEELAWDVHFWLGKYTTQDEAGTAAYKTVELDDFLGGAPVQFREVQGHESQRFLSYFPKGLRILEGGIDSGFHHVKPEEYRPRLLQIKGKKNVKVHEVELSYKSLNSGDAFILDAGTDIIAWFGSKAGVMEKNRASQLAEAIEGEREGRAKNRVLSEGDDDAAFWKAIGGKGPIASAEAGGSDVEEDRKKSGENSLWRLSDASGTFQFTQVAKGEKFKTSQLDSKDVFILDTGEEVYSWVGKQASVGERKKALQFAQEYVMKHNLPPYTPVVRILEGGENEVFSSYFD